ncbi:hypothetical protein CKM354_000226800 [Cercospora kikuchii]|uniref:Uncharacterized protein n=1 Tax=Cercospora kikuchii TaxID=84275 RepID=A0A9P3C9J1_9PEZI|nr:uncharacterized protein CKM354_000226800 [Cercospora kikuchii]GIZ38869.1 hypothetical protein CKM354_000226800 [Cercospora kikuchii]
MFNISKLKTALSGIVSETRYANDREPAQGPLTPLPPIAFAAPMYAGCPVYTQPSRPSYSPKRDPSKPPRPAQGDKPAATSLQRSQQRLSYLRQPHQAEDLESGLRDASDPDSNFEEGDGLLKPKEDEAISGETTWEQIQALFFTCPVLFVLFALVKMHDVGQVIERFRRRSRTQGDEEEEGL